jgi:hypothetical protein
MHHSAEHTASLTYNMVGLAGLEPISSIPSDPVVQNMAPVPTPPTSISLIAVRHQLVLAPTAVEADSTPLSFLNSDRDNSGLPCEQRICSQCRRLLQFQHGPEDTYNPVRALGTGHADPFASLPLEIQPSMWPLLHHCKCGRQNCVARILSYF